MKVAIIGAGNMGGAVARGLAKGTLVQTSDIYVSNPSKPKLEALKAEFAEINTTSDNRLAAEAADIVIIAVKPWPPMVLVLMEWSVPATISIPAIPQIAPEIIIVRIMTFLTLIPA